MARKVSRPIRKSEQLIKRFYSVLDKVDETDIDFGEVNFEKDGQDETFISLEHEADIEELIKDLREVADGLEQSLIDTKHELLNKRITKILSRGGLEASQLIEIIASKEPITEIDDEEVTSENAQNSF